MSKLSVAARVRSMGHLRCDEGWNGCGSLRHDVLATCLVSQRMKTLSRTQVLLGSLGVYIEGMHTRAINRLSKGKIRKECPATPVCIPTEGYPSFEGLNQSCALATCRGERWSPSNKLSNYSVCICVCICMHMCMHMHTRVVRTKPRMNLKLDTWLTARIIL